MGESDKNARPETRPVCQACGHVNGAHLSDCRIEELGRELAEVKKILQDACDRDWEDETLLQTANIASNAIYWRDREIEDLKRERDGLVSNAMVDRFLSWKLPEDFHPDAGISFSPYFNVEYNAKHGKPPQRHEPIGTNLLTATQARAMLEHVLAVSSELPPELQMAVGNHSIGVFKDGKLIAADEQVYAAPSHATHASVRYDI